MVKRLKEKRYMCLCAYQNIYVPLQYEIRWTLPASDAGECTENQGERYCNWPILSL